MAMQQVNGGPASSAGASSSGGGQDGALLKHLEDASKIIDDRLAKDDRVSERLVLESTLQGASSFAPASGPLADLL